MKIHKWHSDMWRENHSKGAFLKQATTLAALSMALVAALYCSPTLAGTVKTSKLAYTTTVDVGMQFAQMSLVSALEGQNYMIVNVLDVQAGLKNKHIKTHPRKLVEFINLRKAYPIIQSNDRMELFAPLVAVLSTQKGKTQIRMLRPRFIKTSLEPTGLSPKAEKILDDLDKNLLGVMQTLASGGF